MPHAHALAPPEYQGDGFQAFLKKLTASWGSASSSSPAALSGGEGTSHGDGKVFKHFWDVPQYSRLRLPDLEEVDMEVVMSGGASALRR